MRDTGRDMTIGERVAWYRRRRGISQEVLAGFVGRTTDWLSKVENGRANLDRLSVIKSLGDALDISVGDLLGEPGLLEWHPSGAPVKSATRLREALMTYAPLAPVAATGDLRTVDALRLSTDDAWSAYQASQFSRATLILAPLVTDARAVLRSTSDGAEEVEANRVLALAYHAAAATLGKLGETELAWIASDRGLSAAEASGDQTIVASLLRSVAHAIASSGRYDEAASLVTNATERLGEGEHSSGPAWWSVIGSLYLTGALAAARADGAAEARTFLARARQAGAQLGVDANHAWTAFGPTNVAVHDVSVAMELGDMQLALHLAPRVNARALPVERRVRHSLEVARLYTRANRVDDAVSTLLQAEHDAPEQVRHHYISRDLVLSWQRNRRAGDVARISGLAERLGLA